MATRYMTTMHAARRARRTELWHVCNSDVGGKSGRAILSFAVLSPPFTDSSQPRSLVDSNFAGLLPRAIAQFGDRPAIVLRGRETSFAGLGRRAAAIATRLTALGVTPGDVCAILARDPADAAAAFFAVLSVGAIGTNLNELYRPRQIEFVVSHSRARVLIIGREVLNALPREIVTNARLLILEDIGETGDELRVAVRRDEDPAQITYTSGSTGQPKGVLMSHANLWAGVQIVAGYLGLRSDDRIASLLPFSFVYGFNQLTTSLYTGATLVVERSTLAQEIVATLRRENVTVLAAVPPLWQQLLGVSAFRETPLETLRTMTNAGGRLPPESVRRLRQAQPQARLFLMYGLTEVFRSTFLPPEEVDAHPDSMGRAIPESAVYVVNERGELAEPGEVGELVHGGPTVGIGYLHDDENSQRVFRPNPFIAPGEPPRVVYSGDLVRRDEEGRLYYVARRDRMIKTMGFRVSPEEITDVLQASGLVADVAIVTEPDPQRGERIIACVVLNDDAGLDQLRKFCGIELPRYMQPARFVALPSIPRNPSGKHDLQQLKAIAGSPTATATTDPPAT
ncbi:MAG TPA: AMP-binding protein [Gemmatimonadaceae bacterium]|nr:AMP-binding protein [Gemmatimonadaceae bacterium]